MSRNACTKSIFVCMIAVAAFLPMQMFAAQVTADSLAAYWKLNETSGTSAVDSSGDGKTGTHTNSPTISSDVPSTAFSNARSLSFDGTDDYVSASSPRTTGNAAFTYALWFKTTNSTDAYRTLFSEGNSGSSTQTFHIQMPSDGDSLCTTDDSIKVYMNDNSTGQAILCSTAAVNDGAWHHVALTSNGSNSHALYIDGTQVDSDTTAISTTTFDAAAIGALRNTTFSQFFPGNIDDVRVYKRALSTGELTDLAQGRHTAATWDGSTHAGFENGTNWSTNAVPDPYTHITIPFTANKLTLTGAVSTANLTINTGAMLFMNAQSVSITDDAVLTNYGTLAVKNTTDALNVSLSADKGTVMVIGTGATTGLPFGNSYYNLTINDGLVTYLKFDETSGTRATDSSGYSASGRLINGAAFSTAAAPTNFYNSGSVALDGSNDYVDTPSNLVIAANKGFMFTAWVRTNTVTGTKLVFDRTVATLGILNIGHSGTSLTCTMRDDNNASPTTITVTNAIAVDTWTHVACGRDPGSSTMRFYINGRLAGVFTGQTGPITSTIRVGNHQNAAAGWNGYIDEVRIYNRSLMPGEVAALAAGNQPSTARGSVTLNQLIAAYGDLTLNGGTLDVSSSNYELQVYGDWANNGGIFNSRKGTVNLLGSGDFTVQSGGQRFNQIIFNQSAGDWILREALTASGQLTLQAGSLDVHATENYPIRAGSLDKGADGSFLPRSGMVILTGAEDAQLSFDTSFNELQIEDATESGLVGYWKFDEGTNSGAILDLSGYNNTGLRSGTGAIWSSSDKASLAFQNPNAMQFNGLNDHVTVPDHASLDLSGTATLSAWVNWGSAIGTDDDSLIDKTQSSDSASYRMYLINSGSDAGKFGFYNGTSAATSVTTVSRGTWHHLAVTLSGSTALYYLDGVLDATRSISLGSANNGPVLIGTDTQLGTRHFNGSLDDVRLYNRTLSAAEIESLYNGFYANGDSGTATTTLIANLDTDALSIFSGKFSGGSETTRISGNLNNYAGSDAFDATYATVYFDGSGAQTIRGSNTFGTMEISTASARTISFSSGSVQRVSSSLTLLGQAGNLLTLSPLTAGTTWYIDLGDSASQSVQYVSPSYSSAIDGLTILADNGTSIDGGNNVNWQFVESSSSSSSVTTETVTTGGMRGHGTNTVRAVATINERYRRALVVNDETDDKTFATPHTQPSEDLPDSIGTYAISTSRNRMVLTTASVQIVYRDVISDMWYSPYVASVVESNIARGYKDKNGKLTGEFGVENPITYAEILKMTLEAAKKSAIKTGPPRNKTAQGDWSSSYVGIAEELGLSVIGVDVHVQTSITRAEVVQLIMETMGITIGKTPSTFQDVPVTHPHSHAIAAAAFFGLIEGDRDANGTLLNTFRPDAYINRAEAAKLIALAKEIQKMGAIAPLASGGMPIDPPVALISSSSSVASSVIPQQAVHATVIAPQLNVRIDSRVESDQLRTLSYGAIVEILWSQSNGWSRIKDAYGREGFVMTQFLTIQK